MTSNLEDIVNPIKNNDSASDIIPGNTFITISEVEITEESSIENADGTHFTKDNTYNKENPVLSQCTPKPDRSSLGNFKRGVKYTSTPEFVPNKKLKTMSDLSTIIEADTPHSESVIEDNAIIIIPESKDHINHELTECVPNENNFKFDLNNITITKKDELSIYCENANLPIKNNLQENEPSLVSSSIDNNLTVKANKDMTITYQNIEDKTIDQIVINEKLELNNADIEPGAKEIFDKAQNLKVFISNDEEENKDNFNAEWEVLKRLETDEERYKVVRKTWKNLTIPNPKQNLTTFNWRRRNVRNSINFDPNFFNENKICNGGGKFFNCSETLDCGIMKLKSYYNEKYREINRICQEEQRIIQLMNWPYSIQKTLQKKSVINLQYQMAAAQEKIERHDMSKKELLAVHSFYHGLQKDEISSSISSNMMKLNFEQLVEIEQTDKIIDLYSTLYE